MADKKISQFEETLNPTLTAFLPIVDEGTNKRIALNTILAQASATASGLTQDVVTSTETTIASVSALLASDVASVNDRVDNILSNVDPATLDSFTEVVAAFQSADSNLDGAITSLASSASTSLASVSADLKTQIDGKQASGSYAAASHSHGISDVTGLQTALDGKQIAGSYAASSHSHTINDVTGLQSALDGKAASSHSHGISDVTGLQTALDGKQASGSYAAASHTHSAIDITDLQNSLTTAVTQASAASKAYTDSYAGGVITLVASNSASWAEPARNFDLVGSSSYCGVAVAGSSNSASVWKITKVTFANDGSVSSTGVASNVVWDNRLTATYL